ncbi:MAG: hypothetical protein LBC17_03950 [Lactobacillaceae bacterium]|nr:hypothetical protein [Lactobacillaceae bacterium]
MSQEEFEDYYKQINGKKPTKAVINAAIKGGRIKTNDTKTTSKKDNKKSDNNKKSSDKKSNDNDVEDDLSEVLEKASQTSKEFASATGKAAKTAFNKIKDSTEEAEPKNVKLPPLRSSNFKTINLLKNISLIFVGIFAATTFVAVWVSFASSGFFSGIFGLFIGLFAAALVFTFGWIATTLSFSLMRNVATIADNLQYLTHKHLQDK